MALPKALLGLLGSPADGGAAEEAQLRSAGFATATVEWSGLGDQPRDWTRAAEILATPGLCAWVLSGPPEAFGEELISQIVLLSLSADLETPPGLAFVLEADSRHDLDRLKAGLPPLLAGTKVYQKGEAFGGRLMAARFQKPERPAPPFYLRSHLSPLTGLWLEAGPEEGETWPGFLLAAVGAEIDALGVGPRGRPPQKCVLEFPMLDIEGVLGGRKWNGCAAKNSLDSALSAFVRLTRPPDKLLLSGYPDDFGGEGLATVLSFN